MFWSFVLYEYYYQYFCMPHTLAMAILYKKFMVLLKKWLDYMYFISDIYSLLWQFKFFVGGDG